jgi:protein-tyrosine phosphatase
LADEPTDAVNFRDAGGYRTEDGHWVKMGEAYRSDALNHLTDADLAKLERLDFDAVCGPRMESERSPDPDRVPAGVTYAVADVVGAPDAITIPRSEAEAALLTALGVPRETVMADYLAGNTHRAAVNEATLAALPAEQAEICKPLIDVRPECSARPTSEA